MYNACKEALHDAFIYISSFLEKSDNLPEIVVNLGLAILTILIPLAIAILTDYYQKRKDPTIEFAVLDLHVILDNVFRIKPLLFYVILIFVSLFIWEKSNGILRLTESILCGIGIVATLITILHCYKWIKGNTEDVWKYRFSYLEKIRKGTKHQDIKIAWRSIWQTQNIESIYEREFFTKFSSTIDKLLKNDE